MAEKKPCVLLAIIIADRVFREEGNHKVHISGTFNEIHSPAYPCVHPSMHLYIALTDTEPGNHTGKVRFVYLGQEEIELLTYEGPFVAAERLGTTELNLGFGPILFPRAGTLEIQFWMDGAHIEGRKIRLSVAPKE